MTWAKIIGLLTVGVAIFAVIFLISVIVVKLSWGWVIPDLFPGAVEQGLIIAEMDWNVAVRLAIVLSVLGGMFAKASSSSSSK